jgi:hypothetical protein
MILGGFVAVTRPDAFDFAVWIKSKNLELSYKPQAVHQLSLCLDAALTIVCDRR